MQGIRLIRNTDRFVEGDPKGTWRQGDAFTVETLEEARELLSTNRARLAHGQDLPADASPVVETASLSGGETPEAEKATSSRRPRDRG